MSAFRRRNEQEIRWRHLRCYLPDLGTASFRSESKLIAEAKKEGGKLLVYSSMETSIAESVGNAFKNKTGIEMEFWRASSTKVMDRVLNEHRAGRRLADIIVTIADPMLIMQREASLRSMTRPRRPIITKSSLIRTWVRAIEIYLSGLQQERDQTRRRSSFLRGSRQAPIHR